MNSRNQSTHLCHTSSIECLCALPSFESAIKACAQVECSLTEQQITLDYVESYLCSARVDSRDGDPGTQKRIAARALTFAVEVGGDSLSFSPNTLFASAGSLVEFIFHPVNHSVVQAASSSDPCHPLAGGIDSGFHPTVDREGVFPTYSTIISSNNTICKTFWCTASRRGD